MISFAVSCKKKLVNLNWGSHQNVDYIFLINKEYIFDISNCICCNLIRSSNTKVSQKFCNILVIHWHNSAALDASVKVVKMTSHTGLWDTKLTWYSLNVTC